MSGSGDYYEILCVPRDATHEQIKVAYRQAALKYHPDRNPGDKDAEDKFKKASEAYSVLGDPEKRSQYDRFGKVGGPGGVDWDSAVFDDFGDLFGNLFGFGDLFGRGHRHHGPQRGADLRYDMDVSLEEVLEGCEKEIEIPLEEPCHKCAGTGAKDGKRSTCTACGGKGSIIYNQGFFAISRSCPQCGGEGTVAKEKCAECRGRGKQFKTKRISVRIPQGVESGSRLKVAGQGEIGDRGGPRGDLYIFIGIKDHPFYVRSGEHLFCRIGISLPEAVLGTEVEIEGIDGKTEKLSVPPNTQHGQKFKIAGKGLPRLHHRGRGDLFVEIGLRTPSKVSKEEKKLWQELLRMEAEKDEKRDSFFRKIFKRGE